MEAVATAAVALGNLNDAEIAAVIALLATSRLLHQRRQPEKPARLDVNKLSDKRFRSLFRFRRRHIKRLRQALQLPNRIVTYNKSVFSGEQALLFVLRRLAYPGRLVELSEFFGVSEPELSMVINKTVTILHQRWGRLLDRLDSPWMTRARLDNFCHAIRRAGAPYQNVWGFLDGTINRVCRPVRHQRLLFSGHKRVHCLKYQAVTTPCGLIANLFGPMEGRRHDMAMLDESDLLNQMQLHLTPPGHPDYVVFADQGYAMSRFVQTPYRGNHLNEVHARFNTIMSSLRVAVEWGFGRVDSLFAFCAYKKNLKVLLSPVGTYYRVAVLLTNCHSCLRRNQISRKFRVSPPRLEQYLH